MDGTNGETCVDFGLKIKSDARVGVGKVTTTGHKEVRTCHIVLL